MPYRHLAILLMILTTIMLSACQSDHETPPVQPSATEKTAPSIEKPAPQTTTAPINLEVSQQSLEQLYSDEEQHFTTDAPVRITKQKNSEQKTKISGGILLDEESETLVESIDGAEVKISVPLH